jgi:hypothetical protein
LDYLVIEAEAAGQSWTGGYIPLEASLRSPVSFDLVSLTEHQSGPWSLAAYLGFPGVASTLVAHEEDNRSVTTSQLLGYLQTVASNLNVEVNNRVFSIQPGYVVNTQNGPRPTKNVIMATGYLERPRRTGIAQEIHMHDYWLNKPRTHRLAVIGTGQGAADLILDAIKNGAHVTWFTSRKPKAARYPVPTTADWGTKTAFGEYYLSLAELDRPAYLKNIGQWQPSIIPSALQAIESSPQCTIELGPVPALQADGQLNGQRYDAIVCARGFLYDVGLIGMLQNLPIAREPRLPTHPRLSLSFQSSSPGLYFTGRPAFYVDGPRQESIISSGPTANRIVHDIITRMQ